MWHSNFLLMKNRIPKIFFACLLFIASSAFAQKKITVYEDSLFNRNAETDHLNKASSPYYVIFYPESIPSSIKLIRQIDERIAIIELNSTSELNLLLEKTKISSANNNWKLSPGLEKIISQSIQNKNQSFVLSGSNFDSLYQQLGKWRNNFSLISFHKPSNSIVIRCKPAFLKEHIIPLQAVIFADIFMMAQTEIGIIGYSRSFHGINRLDYTIPGADGKNIVVGIKENRMNDADIDLYKRIIPSTIASGSIENHATVIASIIGGAGNSFYDGRGIANGSSFYSSSFSNLFVDDAVLLNQNKVTVQNHSYGTIPQQFYGAEALSYDVHSWQNKNFIHIFSAGNKGTAAATDGKYAGIINYANITGNFKMAKNIITVGAIDNEGNIAAESSAGPLYDGRVAPQLIALGPNGTSDAAAVVSGTVAVLQQVYADSNSQTIPPASLVKAVLYTTADDIDKAGPDYKTGYGLINSFAAVKTIQQKKYAGGQLLQGQLWTKDIAIPNNIAQLKITLAWTDTASTLNNNKAIVNDLDLEVQELSSGIVYKPWVLNPAANIDSLAKLAVRKRDSLNTEEQVSLSLPNPGIYQVKVIGTNVTNSLLPFHISYTIDTLNTFVFINPQHTSDVNRNDNEVLTIKWRTFVADTNQTGNLYISYNAGTSWQLLRSAFKIYTNQYKWAIKDTTSAAIFKMETSFGSFFSNNFIISKVTRPKVDFLCTDSFQLSWSKHIHATGYRIFTLTDSPYLKPILVVTDTFKVFKRALFPNRVYAVEPILSNNIPAARSNALDIELQGVYCFYKTFYYNLLDSTTANLILELSVADYIDSVYFEKVSSTGQLLKTYGGVKVVGNIVLYNQLASNLLPGVTYFRAKIKLKSGAVVYTSIISLLTSGNKKIIFYPNPVNKNVALNYVLQQGLSPDTRLQLFDITGRLVMNFLSIPGKIDLSGLNSGVYIYQLFYSDGKIAESGKIIVQ